MLYIGASSRGGECSRNHTNVTLELSYWVMAEHWSTGLAFCFNYVKLEIARSFELKTAD
jgi:hypothetical protein